MLEMYRELIAKVGEGRMRITAYDTAWGACLTTFDKEFMSAFDWICEHQKSDGSWGASIENYVDRVVCTLAVMVALARRGRRRSDRAQIDRGRDALEALVNKYGSQQNGYGNGVAATVGFEMIVPTLAQQAETLGVLSAQGEQIVANLAQRRKRKMSLLSGRKISRHLTAAFSAEMAGQDRIDILEIDNLQEPNGSVATSPSATAYYAIHVRPQDQAALSYLRRITRNGGLPNVSPFDIFERSWVLWNLTLGAAPDELLDVSRRHIEFLANDWTPGQGVSYASGLPTKDADDTAITLEVLRRFGHRMDPEALLAFEESTHFRCFALEADPSVSNNIHVMGTLKEFGYDTQHPSVCKIIEFLRKTKQPAGYWIDKWHLSPYYPTCHAIIAGLGFANELVADSVQWVLATQQSDGSWGHTVSTTEETAYCLQALALWNRSRGGVPSESLKRGVEWLTEHRHDETPSQWIGKCLYCPEYVIESAILSALTLAQVV
jgi:halimadienyl-diphosphate synthase